MEFARPLLLFTALSNRTPAPDSVNLQGSCHDFGHTPTLQNLRKILLLLSNFFFAKFLLSYLF